MDDESQRPPHADASNQGTPANLTASDLDPPNADSRPQVGQSSMEFAQMPSHAYGQIGNMLSAYDMRHMSSALPDYSHSRYIQSQPQHPYSQSPMQDPNYAYATPPNQQFAGQLANQYLLQGIQVNSHLQRGYPGYQTNTPGTASNHPGRDHLYSSQQRLAFGNIPSSMAHNNPHGRQHMHHYMQNVNRPNPSYAPPRIEVGDSQHRHPGSAISQEPHAIRRTNSGSSIQTSSTLRGPPRKPKQSGHALWVGNLPPGTQIIDLKDHFARDATDDIESVFLISKSNCAFVNYKSQETCAAAMARFHDSRFRGVRLVCRLRRGSNSATSPSIAPAASEGTPESVPAQIVGPAPQLADTTDASTSQQSLPTSTPAAREKEKFFVIKSLTVDDLERSVSSGIWATQSQNEEKLNAAFEMAENVYLIFSANKSGEYFGYARMESRITADTAALKEAVSTAVPPPSSSAPSVTSTDVPVTIPTPATSTAPRGYIIDDSARGTIFWEAESGNLTPGSASEQISGDSGNTSSDETGQKATGLDHPQPQPQQPTYGNPFKISWQSTERLPFYRTRGLRNPWNANREVKIARDGTELEPSIGRRLVTMFEQQAQINLASRSSGPPPQYAFSPNMAQYPAAMMAQPPYGYPQGMGHPYGHPY